MSNTDILAKIDNIVKTDSELNSIYSYMDANGMTPENILEKLTALEKLKQMLKDGVVNFVYKKMNGEIREAYGTRADDILKGHGSAPTGKRRSSPATFPYYDIEKSDWRCFKPELLMRICTDYTI